MNDFEKKALSKGLKQFGISKVVLSPTSDEKNLNCFMFYNLNGYIFSCRVEIYLSDFKSVEKSINGSILPRLEGHKKFISSHIFNIESINFSETQDNIKKRISVLSILQIIESHNRLLENLENFPEIAHIYNDTLLYSQYFKDIKPDTIDSYLKSGLSPLDIFEKLSIKIDPKTILIDKEDFLNQSFEEI